MFLNILFHTFLLVHISTCMFTPFRFCVLRVKKTKIYLAFLQDIQVTVDRRNSGNLVEPLDLMGRHVDSVQNVNELITFMSGCGQYSCTSTASQYQNIYYIQAKDNGNVWL